VADQEPQTPPWSEVLAPLRAAMRPALRLVISGIVLVGVFVIFATPNSSVTSALAVAWLVIAPPLLLVWNGSLVWPWLVFPSFALMTSLPTTWQPSPRILDRFPALDETFEGWTKPGMIAFVAVWVGVFVLWVVRTGKARVTRGQKTDPPA